MEITIQRLRELADRSYSSGQYVFTDFLSIAELSVYYENEVELSYVKPALYGGCEIAERKMIRFGNEEELGYSVDFPIAALSVRPLSKKFADELNHRDFLGALMNLGIKRELLGDIFVRENEACLFCKDAIADFIAENLTRIKHTSVKVERTEDTEALTAPNLEEKVIQVSSPRIDAVISKVWSLSRQDALELFPQEKVYLNGRSCTENAKKLSAGDIISVRGRGRFIFAEELSLSKKGKQNCKVEIYR